MQQQMGKNMANKYMKESQSTSLLIRKMLINM